jgi:hypothetical protein
MHARRRTSKQQRNSRGLLVVVIAATALVVGVGMLTCSLLDRRDRGGVLQSAVMLPDGDSRLLVLLDRYTADKRRQWVSLTVIDPQKGQLLATRRVGVGGGVQLAGAAAGAIWLYVGKHLQAYDARSLEPRYIRRQLLKALRRQNPKLKLSGPVVMRHSGYQRFWLHATTQGGRGFRFDPKTLKGQRAATDKVTRSPLADDPRLTTAREVAVGPPAEALHLVGELRRQVRAKKQTLKTFRTDGKATDSATYLEGGFALVRDPSGERRPLIFAGSSAEVLVMHRANTEPDAAFRLSRVDTEGKARWTVKQEQLPPTGRYVAGVWQVGKALIVVTRGHRSRALRKRQHKNLCVAIDATSGRVRWTVAF